MHGLAALTEQCCRPASCMSLSSAGVPCCAATGVCQHFLAQPTVQHLVTEQRAQLQAGQVYRSLLEAAIQLAVQPSMGAQQLAWLAANLLQLLSGSLPSKGTQARLTGRDTSACIACPYRSAAADRSGQHAQHAVSCHSARALPPWLK